MFVDEIEIKAKAGDGGDGVVRWNRMKYKPKGGPAGGNGGNGGDVYFKSVSDLNRLASYTGSKEFKAADGEPGRGGSQYGKGSEDMYIEVPIGSIVTDTERNRVYELFTVGEVVKVLSGGRGGRGNVEFKSSINRSPQEATLGQPGEAATFTIELSLVVDVGLVGLPNAGKSTLLNAFTNAISPVGAYQFTTIEPHLGSLFGYTIADIPGLVQGAAEGKGLGHKFLRHVGRTKMLLHLVSMATNDPIFDYETVRNELTKFSNVISQKEEWIILTKKDLVNKGEIDAIKNMFDKYEKRVFVISENDDESIKLLRDNLVEHLRVG
jgi:GTP-binding protein